MATFSLNSRSLFARNCILATNKQFTKSPLQQAADRCVSLYDEIDVEKKKVNIWRKKIG